MPTKETVSDKNGLILDMHWSEWGQNRNKTKSVEKVVGTAKPIVANLIQSYRPGCRVLDIGSGNLKLKNALSAVKFSGDYQTLDIDPMVDADYRSIEAVVDTFDVVTMLEVIEHLTLEQTTEYLQKIHTVINPGGLLIISTPDPSHPTWIREDISHVQHYPYRDFTVVLHKNGYVDVSVYRLVELLMPTKYPRVLQRLVAYVGILFRNLLTRLSGVNFETKTIIFACKAANLPGTRR